MRVLFMGTPDFASASLKAVYEGGFTVAGVISQPDKPKNRGLQLVPTPVKEYAAARGLEVYQPESLKDEAILPYLKEKNPDVIAVVAYGKLLPKYILEFPKYGCINIHGSLLPKYRGAAPIQWSIINGETETGITSMYMAEGLDTGDIIVKENINILPEYNAGDLFNILAPLGGKVLVETLKLIESGTAPRIPQDDALATYAPILTREKGLIDWNRKAADILNKIRGLTPWPSAYSFYGGKRIKILSAAKSDGKGKPGEVLESKSKLVIATAEGAVEVLELQPENKRRMTASEFLAGNKIPPGTITGI